MKGPSQADLWFSGKPCAWTDLPFELLRDILSYASYPLFDERGQATPHVQWLLKFRNIHPALHEASLAALYFTPPITNTVRAHNFLSLMSQSENRTTNYNVKVRHLELEVRSTLAYSAGAELGSFDLGALVKQLPQLIGIDIWSIMDNFEIRSRALHSRPWAYPDSLFDALLETKQRLRHFHWNSRFLAKHATDVTGMYEWMNTIHQFPSFQSLTYLKLSSFYGDIETRIDLAFPVDFASPGKTLTITQQNKEATRIEKKATQQKQDEMLAKAIGALPNLRKLDFSMCSVVEGEWLQLLPKELTHLGIAECDRITSEGLQEFLSTHGQHLKVLVLNLNKELKISFLTSLAASCPHLEELHMDMTLFRKPDAGEIFASGDYGYMLQADEKPTWPKTLRTISMNHLQYMPAAAAEVFFTSLIESAQDLPDLRTLLLSVSLDVSWRDRAKMRDLWEDKFKRVFLRKPTPPNPHWWSIRSYNEWKAKTVAEVVISPPKPGTIGLITEAAEETATDDDESDIPIKTRKRKAPTEEVTRRLRPRKTTDDESDQPISNLDGSLRDMVMATLELHIQGLCDEVDVRIDNLRPRGGEELRESDFLDSEPSGDEEWNGVDLEFEELYPNGYRKRSKGKGRRAGW
jgi:hypothetical protein